jgi:hypothetical protein
MRKSNIVSLAGLVITIRLEMKEDAYSRRNSQALFVLKISVFLGLSSRTGSMCDWYAA